MPLKHRLARLEVAMAQRRRRAEQRTDFDEMQRGLRELHADPVRLGLLRELRALVDARDLTAEQISDDPEGAAIVARLQQHLGAAA